MDNTLFNKERQLVSIAVITYNSSKYVLETLESIASQTYQNLEVIISDDCSTDNTVNICEKWIEENRDRFVRVELITVNKNTGITPNVNRALRLTKGSWVKFIAGDDILFPRAIQSNMEFISQKEHEDAAIVVSSVQVFRDNIENKLYVWPNLKISNNIREQLRKHLVDKLVYAPGVFIKRDILVNKMNGFNEKYPMLEDAPLWILFLTNGYKFHFNSEILIGYRIHNASVTGSSELVNRYYFISWYSYKKDIVFPMMLKNKFFFEYFVWSEYCYILWEKNNVGDYTHLSITEKIKLLIRCFFKITRFIITSKLNSGKNEYAHPSIIDKICIIARCFFEIIFYIFRMIKTCSRQVKKVIKKIVGCNNEKKYLFDNSKVLK